MPAASAGFFMPMSKRPLVARRGARNIKVVTSRSLKRLSDRKKMRVSYNGITTDFQSVDGGSTPPTRFEQYAHRGGEQHAE